MFQKNNFFGQKKFLIIILFFLFLFGENLVFSQEPQSGICYIGPNYYSLYGTCGKECSKLFTAEQFQSAGGDPYKAWSAWTWVKELNWAEGGVCGLSLQGSCPPGYARIGCDHDTNRTICLKIESLTGYLCSTGDKYDPSVSGIWVNGYLNPGYCGTPQGSICSYGRTPYKVCCKADGTVAQSRSGNEDNFLPSEGYCSGGAVKSVIIVDNPAWNRYDIPSGQPHPACSNITLTCTSDPLAPQAGKTFRFIASTTIDEPPPISWENCSGPNFNCSSCSGNTCTINNAQPGTYSARAILKDNTGKEIASTTCFANIGGTTTRPPQTNIECLNAFDVKAGLCKLQISLIATGSQIKTGNQGEKVVDPDDTFLVSYKIQTVGNDAVYSCLQEDRSQYCETDTSKCSSLPSGCNCSNVGCEVNGIPGKTVFCEGTKTETITNSSVCKSDYRFSGNWQITNKGNITKSGGLSMNRWFDQLTNVIASGTISFSPKKLGLIEFSVNASARNNDNFNGWSGTCLNNICSDVNGATDCSCTETGRTTIRGTEYKVYSCNIGKEVTNNKRETVKCDISLISRAVDLIPQKPRIEGNIPSLDNVKFQPKSYIAGQNYKIIGEIIQNIKNTFNLGLNNKESYQGRGGYYEGGYWGIRGSLSSNANLDDKSAGGGWSTQLDFRPLRAGSYSFQTWHNADDEFFLSRDEETSDSLDITVYRYLCYQGFCWECPQEPQLSGTVLKVREAGCKIVDDELCKNFGYPQQASCKGRGKE